MNINELKEKIIEESEKEAAKILEDAKNQANIIIKNSQIEGEKLKQKIIEDYKQQAEKEKEKIIANAKREANLEIMKKKKEQINKIREILLNNFEKIEKSENFKELLKKEQNELEQKGFKVIDKKGFLLYAIKGEEEYKLTKEMLIDKFIDKILE